MTPEEFKSKYGAYIKGEETFDEMKAKAAPPPAGSRAAPKATPAVQAPSARPRPADPLLAPLAPPSGQTQVSAPPAPPTPEPAAEVNPNFSLPQEGLGYGQVAGALGRVAGSRALSAGPAGQAAQTEAAIAAGDQMFAPVLDYASLAKQKVMEALRRAKPSPEDLLTGGTKALGGR